VQRAARVLAISERTKRDLVELYTIAPEKIVVTLLGVDPAAVDADVAATAFGTDESTRTRLRRLFEKSDEARYSGGGNGIRLLPAETRNEVLELIDHLRP